MTNSVAAYRIEDAVTTDGPWIKALLADTPAGAIDWWRYTTRRGHARAARQHWVVARPLLGFVHWRVRADGVRVVDSIAVTASARRQGIGRALFSYVGTPVEMRVPIADVPAKTFARAMGMQPMVRVRSRGGRESILYRGSR